MQAKAITGLYGIWPYNLENSHDYLNFDLSSSYKVQDQFSETVKIEEKVIQNMTEKTYEDLLIKMSENMLTQWY